MRVEVVWALPQAQDSVELTLPPGTTLREAVERSGLLERHPEIRLEPGFLGIFGRTCGLDTPLEEGDRVELYRPLRVDPKELRRKRAGASRRRRDPT